MKLIEVKVGNCHYFRDEKGLWQGEYRDWHDNGQLSEISHYRDGRLHGEFKYWNLEGKLELHTFDVNGEEIVDFLEKPELYPTTPEERIIFALKYGSGKFFNGKST